jgi:DNA mismatch endonuclease (patch repair protein)
MDFLTKERRSQLMSRVRGRDTKPELVVRRIVRCLGYKFRACYPSLPARPDLAFLPMRKAILVHGCFWHRHHRCRKATMPKTRFAFWSNKFEQNKLRDRTKLRQLRKQGWTALIVWECETNFPDKLRDRIARYLENPVNASH